MCLVSHGMESNPNLLIYNLSLLFLFYLFFMRCFSSLNSALLAHWMTIDGRHRFTFLLAGSLWSLPKIFFSYCLRIISTALHWHRIQYSSFFLSFLSLPYDLARDMLLSPYIITRSCEEKTRALTCTKKNGTCGNEVATKSRIPTALFFSLHSLVLKTRARPFPPTVSHWMKLLEVKFYYFMIVHSEQHHRGS